MTTATFAALWVEQQGETFTRRIVERRIADLPAGEVLVRVDYSSLNYKDALSATGRPGVTRSYPHTPGIDAAGTVVESSDASFAVGTPVIVTGFDLGMNTPGGYGRFIRVPSSWVLPLPEGLTLRESMIYGTAGLTAGLSLRQLLRHGVTPGDGEVLVTGASGGVGSLSVALLAQAGFSVVAATGKEREVPLLRRLGATTVIGRDEVLTALSRPLAKERWAGVVDCVGGTTLAAALRATRYGGAVTCCGLVASAELEINVFPFILRGVSLLGIDSVLSPLTVRREVWRALGGEWKPATLAELVVEVPLSGLEGRIAAILAGAASGRTLVTHDNH